MMDMWSILGMTRISIVIFLYPSTDSTSCASKIFREKNASILYMYRLFNCHHYSLSNIGLRCNSVVKHLPRMHEGLGLIPSYKKEKTKRQTKAKQNKTNLKKIQKTKNPKAIQYSNYFYSICIVLGIIHNLEMI